jgi:hypothetical protein
VPAETASTEAAALQPEEMYTPTSPEPEEIDDLPELSEEAESDVEERPAVRQRVNAPSVRITGVTAAIPDDRTPLEQSWDTANSTSVRPDAGTRLLRSMANRTGSAANTNNSGRDRSRSPGIPVPGESYLSVAIGAKIEEIEKCMAEFNEFRAFIAHRIDTPDGENWKKGFRKKKGNTNKSKAARGKVFVYDKEDTTKQQGIDGSRTKEWEKWKHFNAAKIITKEEAEKLMASGIQALPMQWIDTDKNEQKRTFDNPIDVLHKSRLVGRGDLEKVDVRSDSPTISEEGQSLIFSFAAAHGLSIKSADITNAYFQGEKLTRPMLFRQPKGGLTKYDGDDGMQEDNYLLAQVPVYGTRDAGRGFWKKLRKAFINAGFRENRVFRALYSFTDKDGKLMCVAGSHVDDLLWANHPEAEHIVQKVLGEFEFGKIDSRNFTYCGKEVATDKDGNITITCTATTKKLVPIKIAPGRMKNVTANVTQDEETQLRSVVGILAWIARQCRPDLSYRVSRLQSKVSKATVIDLKECNKVVAYALENPDIGITFKASVLDWDTCVLCTINDASHANELEYIKAIENYEPFRSQSGRLLALVSPEVLEGKESTVHLISHNSTLVKRVCRATLQAEAYSLQSGVEQGDVLRAAIADLYGKLDFKDWETTAAAHMQMVWITDCESVCSALKRPVQAKLADKRLQIEIAALRQSLWRKSGEAAEDPMYLDDKPDERSCSDMIFWIDTDVMLADCLTKQMDPDVLLNTMKSGIWDPSQPIESLQKKRIKQMQRSKKKRDDWEGEKRVAVQNKCYRNKFDNSLVDEAED